MSGYFVTGTDTGVGKTLVACALLRAFAARGLSTVGMKPVAAGREAGPHGPVWEDVEQLRAHGTVDAPGELINPYALADPIAPHVAARREGREIDPGLIVRRFRELQGRAEVTIVEGVGGFRVPLNAGQDTADLAAALGLPVILVVGMRLGCINHALLSAEAVAARGLRLAGWVANRIDPQMAAFADNLEALEERLGCPLLGVLPFADKPDPAALGGLLQIESLDAANG